MVETIRKDRTRAARKAAGTTGRSSNPSTLPNHIYAARFASEIPAAIPCSVYAPGMVLKRVFDCTCTLPTLILLSPLMAAIAIAVKLGDGGPAIYRALRTGLNGREFRMLKFRTMVVDAEKTGVTATADDDHRITRIGRFLRKYKLDELPQLLNVVRGEMSLVGPRPEVPQYTAQFTAEEMAILLVRPGITDWATLWDISEGSLLAGCDDPERFYSEGIRPVKTKLQLKYLRERTFFTDLRILLLTLWSLATRTRPRCPYHSNPSVPQLEAEDTGSP